MFNSKKIYIKINFIILNLLKIIFYILARIELFFLFNFIIDKVL